MDSSTFISRTSLFLFYGCWVVVFSSSNFNKTVCKQAVVNGIGTFFSWKSRKIIMKKCILYVVETPSLVVIAYMDSFADPECFVREGPILTTSFFWMREALERIQISLAGHHRWCADGDQTLNAGLIVL